MREQERRIRELLDRMGRDGVGPFDLGIDVVTAQLMRCWLMEAPDGFERLHSVRLVDAPGARVIGRWLKDQGYQPRRVQYQHKSSNGRTVRELHIWIARHTVVWSHCQAKYIFWHWGMSGVEGMTAALWAAYRCNSRSYPKQRPTADNAGVAWPCVWIPPHRRPRINGFNGAER